MECNTLRIHRLVGKKDHLLLRHFHARIFLLEAAYIGETLICAINYSTDERFAILICKLIKLTIVFYQIKI